MSTPKKTHFWASLTRWNYPCPYHHYCFYKLVPLDEGLQISFCGYGYASVQEWS